VLSLALCRHIMDEYKHDHYTRASRAGGPSAAPYRNAIAPAQTETAQAMRVEAKSEREKPSRSQTSTRRRRRRWKKRRKEE
jgi:hypothetical protein